MLQATVKDVAHDTGVDGHERGDLTKLLALSAELALLLWTIYYFELESRGFFHLAGLAFGGFVVHYALPFKYRLPFFLLLSLAGIGLTLGAQGGWLIGIGLVLIGVCHLPIAFRARVAAVAAVGAVLTVQRGGWLPAPWSAAIWPILGSMFMFRLILYLYELRHDTGPAASWWQRLSYFFLLPNVLFPLFPVVDYKTFRRTYYGDERHQIYQLGVIWIMRGLIQLVLYRLVYYYGSMAPSEVDDLGDLGRYVVSGFLLYLRISGQFHIIVGMLRLFGFNLPETHHLYFLATSFTEFWRRINIYWKDFMMKTFFYPSYFRLRKHGETTALLASTALVFASTWFLHAYQWFWIRGSYLLAWTDVLFWGVLAVLVMANTLYERKHGRERLVSGRAWSARRAATLVLQTLGTFAAISILWSLWTSQTIDEWVSVWATGLSHPSVGDIRLIPAALIGLVAFVGATLYFGARERQRLQTQRLRFHRSFGTVVATVGILALVFTPELYVSHLPGWVPGKGAYAAIMASAREVRLSGHDSDMLERGYYEDLLSVQRFNSQLWEVYSAWPVNWSRLEDTGALRLTRDFLKQELVPSKRIDFRNSTLRTNRWGLRDRDYERQPPAGTYRFALVGSSHVMGYGVDNAETFDSLLEAQLNTGSDKGQAQTIEILNFAVDGYNPPQELFQMERRVFDFGPHAVLYVAHFGADHRATLHIAEMARDGVEIPYPEVRDIVRRAGVERTTGRFEAERRLLPFRQEILTAVYQRMVEACRRRGVVPVWVYLPSAGEVVSDAALARFERFAAARGFLTISLADCFKGYDSRTIWFGEWDRHPNKLGHQLIAQRLYERVWEKRAALFAGVMPPRPPTSIPHGQPQP